MDLGNQSDEILSLLECIAALLKSGLHSEALLRLDEALLLSEWGDARVYRILALVLEAIPRYQEAIQAQQFAVMLSDQPCADLLRLGDLCNAANATEDAKVAFRDALRINAQEYRALVGLSVAYVKERSFDDALEACQQAISINHQDMLARSMLVKTLRLQGHIDIGLMECERALAINPVDPMIHTLRSLLRLQSFDLAGGWSEYEWRFFADDPVLPARHLNLPLWDGRSLDLPLLIWCEQGIGDEIFHLGFLQQLAAIHSDIVVEVSAKILSICRRSFPSLRFIAKGAGLPFPLGYSLAMASIGSRIGPSLDLALSRPKSYLKCETEVPPSLQKTLCRIDEAVFPVGISWLSIRNGFISPKSLQLDDFSCLLQNAGLRLVNLQYGDVDGFVSDFDSNYPGVVIDPNIDKLDDIEALAAVICRCKLILTISNVTAHLACAMGVECWIILPYGCPLPWFWHLHGESSPWYQSATIIRQSKGQSWADVMAVIGERLGRAMNEGGKFTR